MLRRLRVSIQDESARMPPLRCFSRRGRRRGLVGLASVAALLLGCAEPGPPRLLLLISVDTLRVDRLGAYGSERGLTPNLDRLAERSLVFEAAYAPASFTLPSVATLLTGRYPDEIGIFNNRSTLAAGLPTLATELGARGFRTHAVVSNFVLRRGSGIAAGFDSFDDEMSSVEARRNMPERSAGPTTQAALDALESCSADPQRPCFLWVHYQDPHGPYTPPEALRRRYLGRERAVGAEPRTLPVRPGPIGLGGIPSYQYLPEHREVAWYLAGYDGEVRHTDEEIGRLLRAVEEKGLAESGWIVFVADHGESLGEDDYWFSHGRRLSEPLVRVPLLVAAPQLAPGRRDDVVGLVDLFPTLLTALAGSPPDRELAGRDLLADGAAGGSSSVYLSALGGDELPRYGVVEGRFKLVVRERSGGEQRRLSVRGRDGVNLASSAPGETRRLRELLRELRSRYRGAEIAPVQSLSPEESRALEALGYGS